MDLTYKSAFLFGDSIAKGVAFDECENRYMILKDNFAAAAARRLGVMLNNKAKFGCTIRKGKDLIDKAAAAAKGGETRMDVALLEFGGNDCDFRWKEVAEDPGADHQPNTPLPEFVGTYEAIIADLKSIGTLPVILTMPPLAAEPYFRWFSRDIARKDNILMWLGGDVETIYYWHERYNSAVWEVAYRTDCRVIDIRKAFLEQRNPGRFLCADGIHLNQAGNDLVSAVILRSVEEFIRTEAQSQVKSV